MRGLLDTTKEDVLNALPLPYSNDLEDSLMMETAKREKMDLIITRNLKDYASSPRQGPLARAISPNGRSILKAVESLPRCPFPSEWRHRIPILLLP